MINSNLQNILGRYIYFLDVIKKLVIRLLKTAILIRVFYCFCRS